ncbi:unnamed protein product [Diatraea saccharalis]|uniref:Uncharacterized protein n=1 Tax=Diatraea saccharalis TaxID=40085 RepID=A0A9N9RB02_9NEOP|nr:unnamed protein product [Diatraea saccharalis]
MTSILRDANDILATIDQWRKLEETWGNPIDLDTDSDEGDIPSSPPQLHRCTSSFLFNSAKEQVWCQFSEKSALLDYTEFLQGLQHVDTVDEPRKESYVVDGQILSALSVELICNNIDDIFKSIEDLYTVTSTMRRRKENVKEAVVERSVSYGRLSFDDTADTEMDTGDIDKYIDEAFQWLNSSKASITAKSADTDNATKNSVTALVNKFSNIFKRPALRGPRRRRESNNGFQNLIDYWRSKTCHQDL